MASHKKAHLPRGVVLERRNYIGFARTPVIDDSRHFAGVPSPGHGDVLQEPGELFQPERRPYIVCGKP